MIATILLWSYMGFLAFSYGFLALNLLDGFAKRKEAATTSLPVVCITGIAVITVITGFVSLFTRISWEANLVLFLGAVLIIVLRRQDFRGYLRSKLSQYRRCNPLVLILMAIIFWSTLIRTTDSPIVYDTGLYYAQSIRWIEEYPAVPGLGNLHTRLAYNSSWFLPSALFSFAFLGLSSFHVFGGFFYLIVNVYALGKLNSLIGGSYTFSNIAALLSGFLMRRYFRYDLSSPVTDMPAALLVWMVFLLSMEKIESGEGELDLHSTHILIFSLFAITVKVSVVPIVLLPLYFLAREIAHMWTPQPMLKLAFAVAILVPWLARGVIQSGYVLYPISAVNFFDVKWKIPPAMARNDIEWITSWARIPRQDKAVVLEMPLKSWLPVWFSWQNNIERQLYFGILIGMPLLLVATVVEFWRSKANFGQMTRHVILYVTAFAGAGFWFVNAPSFRFGIGFLGALFMLLVAPVLKWLLKLARPIQRSLVMVLLAAFFIYQGAAIYKLGDFSQLRQRIIYPVDYFEPEVNEHALQNLVVYTPRAGDQCWYTSFPCTPNFGRGLGVFGDNLEDGFYTSSD